MSFLWIFHARFFVFIFQVYLPSFLAIDKESGKAYFGEEALNENVSIETEVSGYNQ